MFTSISLCCIVYELVSHLGNQRNASVSHLHTSLSFSLNLRPAVFSLTFYSKAYVLLLIQTSDTWPGFTIRGTFAHIVSCVQNAPPSFPVLIPKISSAFQGSSHSSVSLWILPILHKLILLALANFAAVIKCNLEDKGFRLVYISRGIRIHHGGKA